MFLTLKRFLSLWFILRNMEKYTRVFNKREFDIVKKTVADGELIILFPESVTAFRESSMSISEALDNNRLKGPGKNKWDSSTFTRRVNRIYFDDFGETFDRIRGAVSFDHNNIERFFQWFKPNETEIDLLNFLREQKFIDFFGDQVFQNKKYSVISIQKGDENWSNYVLRHMISHTFFSLSQEYRDLSRKIWAKIPVMLKASIADRFAFYNSEKHPAIYSAHIVESGEKSIFCSVEDRKDVEVLYDYLTEKFSLYNVFNFCRKTNSKKRKNVDSKVLSLPYF